jgi:hypothetical protein
MPNTKQHLLSSLLDREWDAIHHRPRLVARARSWHVTSVPFVDLDELLLLAGYRVAPTEEANEVLRRLVEVAHHDELAARIVMRRLLPGLMAIARRHRRWDDRDRSLEELIGAAWLAILACRTDRSPDRVACTIVRDAAYRAFTAPRRRLSSTEVSVDPHTLDDTPAPVVVTPCEELAELLTDAREAGVERFDLDLVRDLVRVGSPRLVAAERKVTPRTVRNHRDRATALLRQVALAA